jgi:hypothetical protein
MLPKEMGVTFSGFAGATNPLMLLICYYMHYFPPKGHPISVFTTGIGMTVDDIRELKKYSVC